MKPAVGYPAAVGNHGVILNPTGRSGSLILVALQLIDKPDRFFTIIKFWMDATSGVALELKSSVPSYPSRRRGRQNSLTDSPAN
jgi:hypothetical protein